MNKLLIIFVLFLFVASANAQPDPKFWDKTSVLSLGGGITTPGSHFSNSTTDLGLFAKKGYNVNFDYNYIISHGFGMGMHIDYNYFKFDEQAFMNYAQPDLMHIKGGYTSTGIGLNLQMNMPIVVHKKNFTFNVFAEGNAGFRGVSIPSIDLEYDELFNKYVEVNYRSRSNLMGYLGYNAGMQFIFANVVGLKISYAALMRSRHSINYSVRMFDAQGELYEAESYLNNYLDHTAIKFALVFYIGKK